MHRYNVIPHRESAAGRNEGRAGTGWVPVWLTAERLLWALVLVMMALDVVTTELGLQHGLAEGNPVVASVIGGASVLGLVGAKLLALTLVVDDALDMIDIERDRPIQIIF